MKKFFTILTMALLFAGNAWGDWGTQHRVLGQGSYYYTKGGSEVYLQLDYNVTYDLALVVDNVWFGRNSDETIQSNWSDAWLEQTNDNKLHLKATMPGWYKISTAWHSDWNYGNGQRSISVTFPYNCYLKHNWRGDSWEFVKMTKKSEGVYTYVAAYNGNTTFNCLFGFDNIDNDNQGNKITATLIDNPQAGDRCYYEYNLTNNSLTVTKLQWNVVYRKHENLQSAEHWSHVEVDANNQAVLPNLTINTMYDLGLYDGVNFYSTTAAATIDHLTPNSVLAQTNATNLQFETTYAGDYTVTLDLSDAAAPKVSAAYPTSGDAYIFGYFNNAVLNDEVNFTTHNGVVDVNFLTADKDENFRIYDGGRRCTDATITSSTTLSEIPFLATGSNDIYKLHTTIAGKYRFKYTQSTHTLEIIYPNTITLNSSIANGDIDIVDNLTSALPGEKIVVTTTPTSTGYYLKSLKAYKGNQVSDEEVSIALDEDGNYYFVMPDASVYVTAEFTNQAVPTTDNHYFARSGFAYSAGMSIAASDITVTLSGGCGNLVRNEDYENWVDSRFKHVIQFDTPGLNKKNGTPTGSFCQFVPAVSGQLTVAIYLPAPEEDENVNMFVKEGTTRIYPLGNTTQDVTKFYDYSFKVKDEEGVIEDGDLQGSNGFGAEAYGTITFEVAAGQTYYVFSTGAPMGFQGFIFSPDVKAITGANYYTTFYDSRNGYVLPEGVEAFAVVVNGNTATLVRAYSGDDENNNILPHNCGVILRPTAEKINSGHLNDANNTVVYRLNYSYTNVAGTNAPAAPASNSLKGTDEQKTTPTESGDNYYYKLSYNKANQVGSIGFYWGNETGSEFTNGKHKAYLVVPQTPQAPDRLTIVLPGTEPGITTGVEETATVQATKTMVNGKLHIVRDNKEYDINGRIVK